MGTTATPSKKPRQRAPRAVRENLSPTSPTTLEPITPISSTNPNPPTAPPITKTPKKWNLKAEWDDEDDSIMIEVLTDERQPGNAPIGPGNATSAHGFKSAVWTKVVEALAGSEEKKNKTTGLVQVSAAKTIKACKDHWYVLSQRYSLYKYLNGLSGAGWKDGCIDLDDRTWAPIVEKDTKRAKDLLRCRGRPFPLFDSIGTLLEGHKATGKYVAGGIVKTDLDFSPTITKPNLASTSSSPNIERTRPASPFADQADDPFDHGFSSPPPESHPSDASESMDVAFKPKDDSDSDEPPAAKQHRKSKAALTARAPVKSKKRSGIQILDGMSSDMKDFGSNIQSSFASTSASIDTAAQKIQDEKPSTHASAVSLIYKSSLENTQRYVALDLFAEKPLIAETYVNTPARERDGWLQYILNKKN